MPSPQATIRLSLLGAFELRCDADEIPVPPNGQRVLAFLALQRRPIRRARVSGTLWSDASESQASASLRSALWRVRRCHRDLVRASGEELALGARVEVDVDRLSELARTSLREGPPRDSAAALPEALLTDLLPGWYEDWVTLEQERLRQLQVRTLERYAAALARRGDFGLAVDAALVVLQSEPLRESAHRLLIEIHLAEGNRAEAVRQFRRLEGLLRRELGLEPSPSLRALIGFLPYRRGDAPTTVR